MMQTRNHIHFLLSQVLRTFILSEVTIFITDCWWSLLYPYDRNVSPILIKYCNVLLNIILYYLYSLLQWIGDAVPHFGDSILSSLDEVSPAVFPRGQHFSRWNVHAVAPVQLFLLDETHLHLIPQTSDHFTLFPAISSNVKVIKLHQIVMNKSYHNGFPKRSKKKKLNLYCLYAMIKNLHLWPPAAARPGAPGSPTQWAAPSWAAVRGRHWGAAESAGSDLPLAPRPGMGLQHGHYGSQLYIYIYTYMLRFSNI